MPLIEIKVVNPQVTRREFINADVIERVYLDDGHLGHIWVAVLKDGQTVRIIDKALLEEWEAAADASKL